METEPTRETGIGIAAVVLAAACAVLALIVVLAGGWWRLALVPLVPVIAASTYGATVSLRSLPRGPDGNPLR